MDKRSYKILVKVAWRYLHGIPERWRLTTGQELMAEAYLLAKEKYGSCDYQQFCDVLGKAYYTFYKAHVNANPKLREFINRYAAEYRKLHPKRIAETARKAKQKAKLTLSDSYITQLLRKSGYPMDEIKRNPELITERRTQALKNRLAQNQQLN